LILAATGHRPSRIPGWDNSTGPGRLFALALACLDEVKPIRVLSGMALGWDTAIAQAAITLDIPLIAAVPFDGQEDVWKESDQAMYHHLLSRAADVITIADVFSPTAFEQRNRWLVENSEHLIAFWSGRGGGTANCLRYADSVGKPWWNVWQ
jgi:uncharacterized phage-like protein YoqJ